MQHFKIPLVHPIWKELLLMFLLALHLIKREHHNTCIQLCCRSNSRACTLKLHLHSTAQQAGLNYRISFSWTMRWWEAQFHLIRRVEWQPQIMQTWIVTKVCRLRANMFTLIQLSNYVVGRHKILFSKAMQVLTRFHSKCQESSTISSNTKKYSCLKPQQGSA